MPSLPYTTCSTSPCMIVPSLSHLGDSLYPGIIDPECEDGQAMSHDLSMLELADKHPHTNHFVLEADTRMEGNTPMMGVLDCNIEQLDGHVSPIPTVVHHGDGVNVDDATPHAKL